MNAPNPNPTPESDSSRYLELFELIEKHGLFSPEVEAFRDVHQGDAELAETLAAARRMKASTTRAEAAEPSPRAAAGGVGMAGVLAIIACVALPMAAAFQFALRNAPIASPDVVAKAAQKAVDDSSASLQEKVKNAVVAAMPKSSTDPKAVGELVAQAVRVELAKAGPANFATEASLQKLVEGAVASSFKRHEERMLKSFPSPDDVKAVKELIAENKKEIEGLRIAIAPPGGAGMYGKTPVWIYTGKSHDWSKNFVDFMPAGDKGVGSPFATDDYNVTFPDFAPKNKLKSNDLKKSPNDGKLKPPPKSDNK